MTQVYEEGSAFRSRLKEKARIIVTAHYKLFTQKTGLTTAQKLDYTVKKVKRLLNKGAFLQNGKDENVGSSFLSVGSC